MYGRFLLNQVSVRELMRFAGRLSSLPSDMTEIRAGQISETFAERKRLGRSTKGIQRFRWMPFVRESPHELPGVG